MNTPINLVPRAFSSTIFQDGGSSVEDPGTQQKSRDQFVQESGNLFKMAAKIKSERVWVRGLETGENKQNGGKGELVLLGWAFK